MLSNINTEKKRPKLSVVVIAYNNELYIEEALESLDEQTFDDFEVVVVNDFSTDRTGELIERFIEGKPKFKVIHLQENSGGCSTPRNTGIAHTTGEYIMFLDGDDWYPVDACEKMVAAIERTNSELVAGQVIRTNNYRIWYHKKIYSIERVNINVREFPKLLHDSLSVNKIYKRSFLDRHRLRFPEGIHYEDIVFSGKAYFLADSISIIPEPVYFWRVVENADVKSITHRRFEFENFKNRITAHRLFDQFLKDNGDILYQGHKNKKFLAHDLKLYTNDYLQFDDEYKSKFHELIYEYLHEVMDEYSFIKLSERERILYYLLYIGDKEAFQDYLSYINGLPTKVNRIYSKGNSYYFKSTISEKDHEKFLLFQNLDIKFTIDHLELTHEKLLFNFEVHIGSIDNTELSYYWALYNKDTKSTIQSVLVGTNQAVLSLENMTPGKYYLYLYVNHQGNTHKRIVKKTNISNLPNLKVADRKFSKFFYINKNNSFAVKVLSLKKLDQIKWSFKIKKISKKKKGFFETLFMKYAKIFSLKLPIRSNWVLFESHMGKQYSDSPKYIYEEMSKTHRNYKFIWSFEDPELVEVPGSAIKVKRKGLRHFYYMVRSKYWVDNQGMAKLAPKRKQQVYLQTWHGTPLKRMGYDQKQLPTEEELAKLQFQKNAWDYFISPNSYSTTIFRRAFRYGGKIIETGYPRNDLLITKPEGIIQKTRESFQIGKEKRIILFAPTFRDWDPDSFQKTLRDIQSLSKGIGEDSIVLLRLHYLLSDKISNQSLPRNVINASRYHDIQELYLIADILITDYSSVMFDYALLKRPILLYCYDLEEYLSRRGTYFNLIEKAPGPVCTKMDEVIYYFDQPERLRDFNQELEIFSSEFGSSENGHAASEVIAQVFK